MLYAQYALGDRLHKTIYELDLMLVDEFNGWMAYVNLKDKAEAEK